ncbi:uncharacterized protein UV8b_06534 [Ustilaginoidea virens]|uniref:Secreted cysteine-rich effector 2 n=2 Tax=Ustilaginoidea virens TaxID=1159556 RepID=SCRE2_USTVR|nr:uncharacterized protein UV8b_06534 [Ustilaginoidea virens]A0A063CBJ7.1 RecName: Full=Secreted cysteine-rich effector 2; Flags: Precursor [Ustilaginoidea virens]QUC22293.1 hypothetical protein UV8b_06534 [Ustilaginoidea virens]GAO14134.1 hypothetical protein UVI_02037790 [Ustilaginoidea virens]
MLINAARLLLPAAALVHLSLAWATSDRCNGYSSTLIQIKHAGDIYKQPSVPGLPPPGVNPYSLIDTLLKNGEDWCKHCASPRVSVDAGRYKAQMDKLLSYAHPYSASSWDSVQSLGDALEHLCKASRKEN